MSYRIAVCRSQPISHLRLEQHLQGDGSPGERARIDEHLESCDTCRSCFEELQRDVIAMPPLPLTKPNVVQLSAAPSRARKRGPWLQLSAAVLAAAAALLSIRKPSEHVPAARVAIKGGELALELLRERHGERGEHMEIDEAPTHYAPGDRLQARISCPPNAAIHWDLVVFQAGEVSYPLTPSATIACRNGITLPGAFSLDDAGPARICVVIGERAVPRDTTRLEHLPAESACLTLQPSAGAH